MANDVQLYIDKILLDLENPRFPAQDSQLDVLQAILDDQGSKIVELAADIVEFGLNPMDRIMVLKKSSKSSDYVVLEGNRRTAALKFLAKPTLLNDVSFPDNLRARLIELAGKFSPKSVEPIPGVLMPNRDAARRWIEQRHTGQNRGRGIVDWNGMQTARFRGERTLSLLEFVANRGELSPEEKTAVESKFPITTLDRLISNPHVRHVAGLQILDGEFHITRPWEEVLKPLRRMVLDLAQKKITVTNVKSKDQQVNYIDGFLAKDLPSGGKLPAAIPLASALAPSPPPTPPPKPVSSPLDRNQLIPSSFFLAIPNTKVSQIFWELRSLNIKRYPVSGAVLLRAFVEASVDVYCSKHSIVVFHGPNKPFSLSEKVEAVLKVVGLNQQEAKAARIALTSKDSVISVSRLHEYVHNPGVFPSKNDLIAAWSGVEAFFRAIWK